jgi:hypothetical protein
VLSSSAVGNEKDIPCVVCDQNVTGTVWLLCAACEVPAHKECWDRRGSCPVFGCGSRETMDPAAAIFRKKTALVPRPGEAPLSPQQHALQQQIHVLQLSEGTRQGRQGWLFGAGLAGWVASLAIASSVPAFYMLGGAWFLAFIAAAGFLELRIWQAARHRRELEKRIGQGDGAAAR